MPTLKNSNETFWVIFKQCEVGQNKVCDLFKFFFCIVSNYYHGNWDYDYCNKKITLCSIKGFTATLQVLMSSFWPKRLWHFQRDDKWHLSHVSQKCICYCVLSHKLENNNVIALLFWFDRKNYFSDDDNWFALHLVQIFFSF